MRITLTLGTIALAVLLAAYSQGLAGSPARTSVAASQFGQPVPDSAMVRHNGLEWVWAGPCADNGCSDILVGHEGFRFATVKEWASRPPISAFTNLNGDSEMFEKCASPWFSTVFDWCDVNDALIGFYGSAPEGGLPAGNDGTSEMGGDWETWLVRGELECPFEPDDFQGLDEDELAELAEEEGLDLDDLLDLCEDELDDAAQDEDDEQPRFLGPGFGAIVSGDQAAQNRARANAVGAAAAAAVAAPAPAPGAVRPPSTGDGGLLP